MAVNKNTAKQTDDTINLQDMLALCLSKWKWFVVSIVCCLSIAIAHLLTTPPSYKRSASVLVKEDSKGSSSLMSELSSISDMGMFNANTNVNNVVTMMQSPALVYDVVKRLHLEYNYTTDATFRKETLYGLSLPITAEVEGLGDNETCSFTVVISKGGKLFLKDIVRGDSNYDEEIECSLNKKAETPIGTVVISSTMNYKDPQEGEEKMIYVTRSGAVERVNDCLTHLTVVLNDVKNTIVDLSYNDVNIQRAEEFLNVLITIYNENWVKDKNQAAVTTSQFINERLKVIEQELGNVDGDISSFKSKTLIPDLQQASSMYMSQANENNAQILELNIQLYMARYIRDMVNVDANKNQLLPANSGINSPVIERQIVEYNTKLLQRNSLEANSSVNNPLVKDMDEQLRSMRGAIISSIDNQVNSINTQIEGLRSNEKQITSQLASNPSQAKYLLSVERQQKVKEALYLFLLQKREENELSQAFTAYNTRIITPPYGELKPFQPVKRNILLVALLLGLLIPLAVVIVRENTNTKVRGRKDMEKISVPLVGEIPLIDDEKRRKIFPKKSDKWEKINRIVVTPGSRDVINEAFRVLRSNIEFMTDKEKKENVFVLTSFNPNSGKSFLTMNLTIGFAIKKRRVLVIDGDLRKGSASSYINSPSKGITDYLSGKTDEWKGLIVKDKVYDSLEILPIGKIPPNPTELLEDGKFAKLLQELRPLYDYIFIDCPPIDIVADTQIIEKFADRTLFVVRSEWLERSMLQDLEKMYTEKRFKNLCTILNGTKSCGGRYSYRYGSYNSYGYGYGKSYYSNSSDSPKNGGGVERRIILG